MKTVHKVCTMLRKHDSLHHENNLGPCKQCPRWEKFHGRTVVAGCRVQAEEYVNIVKFGNPWGKKYQRTRRSWPDRTKYTGSGKVR